MGTHREATAMTRLRNDANMNQRELAAKMGLSQAAISQRETGRTDIDSAFLAQLLPVLGKSQADWDHVMGSVVEVVPKKLTDQIPFLGTLARVGRYIASPHHAVEPIAMVPRGSVMHPDAVTFTHEGDSMASTLLSGDEIVVEPIKREDLVDGAIVCVWQPELTESAGTTTRARQLVLPPGGTIGRWWWNGTAGRIEKDNKRSVPIELSADVVATLRFAKVVQLRRVPV